MSKGVHCRTNTNTLHHRNQYQQNYTRDKKTQRYQNQIARQKVKVVCANKPKVNITNCNRATAVSLSLLVFSASVFSDIVLSNPKMPPRIKNNTRSTKNTQDVTEHQQATFNNHSWQQQPVSKIIPVSVRSEQKNHLVSNQSNLPKVDSNFKNYLNTTKNHQNSSIKKNPQHKLLNFPGVISAPIKLDNYYKGYFHPISYQPPLENNIAREAALFKELLKPFKNLDPLAQEKATLLTILHRLAANARYEPDIDTAGVDDYWSTTKEILSRGGKGIDCEDYAILANFYAMHAQELSYLPQDAKFGMILFPGHALFYYERTLPNEDNPEFYVIDNNLAQLLSITSWWLPSCNYLKTLKEHTYNLATYFIFFLNLYDYKNIPSILAENNHWFFQVSRSSSGEIIASQNLRLKTAKNWSKRLNNNRRIDDSISADEISLLQYNYIKEKGGYSIPEGIEFSEDNINYIEALEIKNILGYSKLSKKGKIMSTPAVTSITANQAKYLIGSYSQNLNKVLTIHDLPAMTEDQKEKLLGMYSPVLNRQLINEDVFP